MFSSNIDIGQALLLYVCLLFSLCCHEAAHAMMANRCGDPSARLMGRMSLNPLAHIDPIGTVLLPIIVLATGAHYLFGWAKPVPFNPRNLNDMRRDPALIALAGPLSNLILALASVLVLRILIILSGIGGFGALLAGPLGDVIVTMIGINLVLMVFNLIPVPPLDGHHVLYIFLPPSGQQVIERIGPFGILIAIYLASPVFRFVMPPLGALVHWLAYAGTGVG